MTVDLVATYLRVPVDTVEAWCDDGGIPHIKLGRMLRFDVDELQAWVHDRALQPSRVRGLSARITW